MLPDRERMLSWLRGEAVTQTGSVLSWVNPAHPGYGYPEAAGLVLHVLAQEGSASDFEDRIARSLCASASEAGGVGRDGIDYVFDTAAALRGLLAFERAGGALDERAAASMFDFIARSVEQKRPVSHGPVDERWSNGYNPHLLKVVLAIDEWEGRTADPRCAPIRTRLVETLFPLTTTWFEEAAAGVPRYVHALCYAAEALLHLSERGMSEARTAAAGAAALLARLQWDGALPAWSARGPEHRLATDATAQAVRLWSAIDPVAFAGNMRSALAHLSRMQRGSGGLTYAPAGDDMNTWCTVFAAQATLWAERGPVDPLI
jgi:hypothetical protein